MDSTDLTEIGWKVCECGHVICSSHQYCPFCNLEQITQFDIARYLLKKSNRSTEEIRQEIAATFSSHKDLDDWLR